MGHPLKRLFASNAIPFSASRSSATTPSQVLFRSINCRIAGPITDASIDLDPNPKIELVSIVSNEPDDGLGDGDTPNDIQDAAIGTDDRSFLLRAERSGEGSGRVYTVTYRATDSAGNATNVAAQVNVPLNQGKP